MKRKAEVSANRIKEFLEKRNMCQQELADLVETNCAHISKLVSKQRKCISVPIALKIAKALNTTVEELFGQ